MSNFNRDPFGDDFDKRFDSVFEKAVASPGKTASKVILAAIALNVLYFFILCGIVAFFVWLLFL